MSTAAQKGAKGELLAREYLKQLGLVFLSANWRCKMGEIDLIFQDGDTRVFVEVRTRKSTSFGNGADTVFFQKQRKLIRAAKYYQQKEQYWGNIRFDVISIELRDPTNPTISYIPDAFTET